MPSAPGDARPRRHLGEPAEPPVQHAKTPVINSSSRSNRLRVAIERDQPSRLSQPRQDQPAVPAAAERAIDVAAVAAHLQTVYCLLQQDRGM